MHLFPQYFQAKVGRCVFIAGSRYVVRACVICIIVGTGFRSVEVSYNPVGKPTLSQQSMVR